MSQTQFQYTYGNPRDAEKNAKRLRSHEFYTVVVQHPVTRRYLVLFCDTDADLPTRVPILAKYRDDPPRQYEPTEADRWNALRELVERGDLIIALPGLGVMPFDDVHRITGEWYNR